jgi:hypothetical protein
MTINSTTAWQSDLAPGTIFKTHEEATLFELVTVPRLLVKALIEKHGSGDRIDSDDAKAIDAIVNELGALWGVRGYAKPQAG